jgi:RNA 2',3'-cyclic 3'-phosphodiesterase
MGERRGEKERLRIFLAVFPPPEVQAIAERAIDLLRAPDDRVSWVKRDNLHYTLRFLGDLGEDGARRAAAAARAAVVERAAFPARLGPLGCFPNPPKARVLWIGLSEGAETLTSLSRRIETALREKGFERADRPFAPHLTIGRVREPGHDWTEALARANATLEIGDGRFTVDRVVVVHSQLSPKGSIYRVRAEAPLAGVE